MRDEVDRMQRNSGCNPVWMDPETKKWFEEQNCAPETTPQEDKPDMAYLGRQWVGMMTDPERLPKADYVTYTNFLEKYATCFEETDDMTSRIRNVLKECRAHYTTMNRADMLNLMARCLTIKNKQKFQEKLLFILNSTANTEGRKKLEQMVAKQGNFKVSRTN